MSCLTADSIYLFLEGELSPAEAKQVRTHCTRCAACREALEERRQLNQAAQNLSAWPFSDTLEQDSYGNPDWPRSKG